MFRPIRIAVVACFLCAAPALADELKVDGSTPDTTSASLHAIYAQHGNREICLLQSALINIAVGEKNNRAAKGESQDTPAPAIGTFINGLTYDGIIDKSHDYPSKVTALCRD